MRYIYLFIIPIFLIFISTSYTTAKESTRSPKTNSGFTKKQDNELAELTQRHLLCVIKNVLEYEDATIPMLVLVDQAFEICFPARYEIYKFFEREKGDMTLAKGFLESLWEAQKGLAITGGLEARKAEKLKIQQEKR